VVEASQRAWDLGINPGGEVLGHPLDVHSLRGVPKKWRERLLSADDLDRLEILYQRGTWKDRTA
jgi:hypothetical protein